MPSKLGTWPTYSTVSGYFTFAASCASAVKALIPSPASTSRFIAKISTRVRLSPPPKSTDDVNLKGSGLWVMDSKATARVEVGLLKRTGGAAEAELIAPDKLNSTKAGRARTKIVFAQGDRLVFIDYGSINR